MCKRIILCLAKSGGQKWVIWSWVNCPIKLQKFPGAIAPSTPAKCQWAAIIEILVSEVYRGRDWRNKNSFIKKHTQRVYFLAISVCVHHLAQEEV